MHRRVTHKLCALLHCVQFCTGGGAQAGNSSCSGQSQNYFFQWAKQELMNIQLMNYSWRAGNTCYVCCCWHSHCRHLQRVVNHVLKVFAHISLYFIHNITHNYMQFTPNLIMILITLLQPTINSQKEVGLYNFFPEEK